MKIKKILWTVLLVIILALILLPVITNVETEELNAKSRKITSGNFISLKHGITHYEETGPDTAQTILLVHGFSVPYYIWDPTFKALKENGFHVIRFDLYGRGYSDRPDAEYNHDLFTEQIADLLSALNINKPIDIIGVSMGGAVSTEFTVTYPEKVNKLILIDPVHKPFEIGILSVPLIGEYKMNVCVAPKAAKSQLEDFYNPSNFSYWPEKYKDQMKYKGFKRAILSTWRNYMTEDKLPVYIKLGKLNKPTLLIWGKQDATIPFMGNERIRKVIDCSFLQVDEAGHLPHYENPDIVNNCIIKFIHGK